MHPGNNWIRLVSNGGPYSPKKNVPEVAELGSTAGVIDWGFAATAQNVHIMRFADVLLLDAEVEAELGNLAAALASVNLVRNRAVGDAPAGSPAMYGMQPYVAFATQAAALTAIRFERKLELGMEGHRMFDLVRWDYASKAGLTALAFDIANYINNEYLAVEKTKRPHLSSATFTAKYKFMPIPDGVVTNMTQNGVKNIDQNTEWGGTRAFSIN
jgi:hypothetical protein